MADPPKWDSRYGQVIGWQFETTPEHVISFQVSTRFAKAGYPMRSGPAIITIENAKKLVEALSQEIEAAEAAEALNIAIKPRRFPEG